MDRASERLSDEARRAGELLLDLELRRGKLRETIGEALRVAVQDGRLTAGTTLPSSRGLAADLGVSRGVVSDVYDQLVSESYLEVAPRSAPTVSAVFAAPPPAAEPAVPAWRFDFNATTPDVRLFPRRTWARAVERALREAPDVALDYGHHRGHLELRRALSSYLGRVRGVRVDAGRIVVTQGFTQALDLLCRVLVARGGSALAMETPSHPDLHSTVRRSGLRLVGCPIDEEGLRVDELLPLAPHAVVVTPAHQFPTGVVMAPARRVALLEWAESRGRLVIEDDYDAEFRYDRRPVGAIQGLNPERVAHVGTVSKTLAPGVRLGWVSLPSQLVDDVRDLKGTTDSGSPAIDQLALALLLSSGAYERHVVRARTIYRRRRDRLVGALTARFPRLRIHGAAAGMQVLLRLPHDADDTSVVAAAAARSIGLRALSPLHVTPTVERGLLLGFGRLPEDRIERAVDALAFVLAEASVGSR